MSLTHDEILAIGKFMSELFALVTTLDTGMVGVIIAFVEKVFTTERVFKSIRNMGLLLASLLSFIASLALSLFALATIPYNLKEMLLDKSGTWVDPYAFYGSLGLFFFGVFFFFILAITSVFSGSALDHHVAAHQGNDIRKVTKRR